jgi:preprotein translocase subunit SecE
MGKCTLLYNAEREVGGNYMQRIVKFFRDVVREMKKVSWPKKKELTKYTITTIVTVTFVALFFTVVDMGISSLIRLILG